MTQIRPRQAKSYAEMIPEWDRLAEERHRQIASGEDISFEHIILPTIWRLLQGLDLAVVLDIGSGTGDFTERLARVAGKVIAIEPSHENVRIARKVCKDRKNVQFIGTVLEEARELIDGSSATSAVAVMSLMAVEDLRSFSKALGAILRRGTSFVATITHPWFWPRYWGYEGESWFHYDREIFIEGPFAISLSRTELRTTHIHRPLEQYIDFFTQEGFQLSALVEPMPTEEVEALYPVQWQFPRFLGLRWEKVI